MNHKTINYIINGVLAVGIISLFILQLGEKQCASLYPAASDTSQDSVSRLSFAYINVDSLVLNYYLAMDLRGQIVVKEENSRSIITQRVRSLELQMRKYKQKLEENPFLPHEQSDAEYRHLQRQQQEIFVLENQLTQELKAEQDRVYQQLYDSIIQQLKRYNEVKKVSIIFSNTTGDNILYAKESYNMTQEVIDFLNASFTSPSLKE
ncbi:MAG: OmpH family outer membrane protein [Massilibacteroides sp.]|nr:OmpH family outer membrane protein [Massilibacteroides sp.]MDD3063652.1 OmpH family outer membrane protein [Massilibacteroides sp.]MDD4114786.1 OmpH family outer membrane protein [Massilibacteroides sp.]MDD4661191.1 OmpH family outer membrane protein [Massilibacteroides sp.]